WDNESYNPTIGLQVKLALADLDHDQGGGPRRYPLTLLQGNHGLAREFSANDIGDSVAVYGLGWGTTDTCAAPADCASGVCTGGVCPCTQPSDCWSGVCAAGTCYDLPVPGTEEVVSLVWNQAGQKKPVGIGAVSMVYR